MSNRAARTVRPRTAETGLQREHAYAVLRRALLGGGFSDRPLLSARGLAKELGVGLTPLRSALERLEGEGLITITPQRGIAVRGLTAKQIADHYEIRTALESFIVRRLAGTLSDEQARLLRENLDRQRRAVRERDIAGLVETDTDFHMLLAAFLGNEEILRTLTQLRDKIRLVIARIVGASPARMLESAEEHIAIGQAVIDGNGDRAAELLVHHLERGRELLIPSGTS